MAEIAGLVISAVGIAAEGLKLSENIADFIGRFQNASEEIRLVVSDVQATAEVLEQLKESLDAENQADLNWTATKSWYQQTKRRIGDCYAIFNEIKTLVEAVERPDHVDDDPQNPLRRSDRLKWAFSHQRKAARWQGRLNMLKQDFVWRLQVSRYSQEERDRRLRKRFAEQGRPNRAKVSLLEMQISKLSLELSTVKHEEAERLYKAQKLTGFVDLGRSLDPDDPAHPPTDLPVDIGDAKNNIRTTSREKGKSRTKDITRQHKTSQTLPDDLGTALTHVQERPWFVGELQNNIDTTYTNHDPDDDGKILHQRVRRRGRKHGGPQTNAASAVVVGDVNEQPQTSALGGETHKVFLSETTTVSPKLLNPQPRLPSRLEAGNERVSSSSLDDDALILESVPIQSHKNNPATTSPEDRANSLEINNTGSGNQSPTLLPDASAKFGLDVVLEASHPEPRTNNESQMRPQVIPSDETSKNVSSAGKGADSATKATKSQRSLVEELGFPTEAGTAPPTPAISVDETDTPNVGQSAKRGIISWRPKFMKSRKERVSGGPEVIAQPPLSRASSIRRPRRGRQATVESASDSSSILHASSGAKTANELRLHELKNAHSLPTINQSRSSPTGQPKMRSSPPPPQPPPRPLPPPSTEAFRNYLSRGLPPFETVQVPGANTMPGANTVPGTNTLPGANILPGIISRDVIDLRVPRRPPTKKPSGGVLPVLEGWILRRAEPGGGLRERSWSRITRVLLPITFEEMDHVVRAYGQSGNRFWDEFCNLSRYQQMQVDRLLEDKRSDDPDQRYEWVLAAIKTDPMDAKRMDIVTLQIIIQRRLRVGVLALAANNPRPGTRRIGFSASLDDDKGDGEEEGEEDGKEDDTGTHKRQHPRDGPPPRGPSSSRGAQLSKDSVISAPISAAPEHTVNHNRSYPDSYVPTPAPTMMNGAPNVASTVMSGALPSQGTYPPSASPYILRETALHRGSGKQIPRVLDWIASSRRKGKRDRVSTQDEEGQFMNRSRLTSDWVDRDNSPPASDDRYRRGFIGHHMPSQASAQYNYDRILPLFQEFLDDYSRRQYGNNGLSPSAFRQGYPQNTGQYLSPSDVRFDSQALYPDRPEPLRLLNVPENSIHTPDNNADNLTLDYYNPRSSTAMEINRRHPDANNGVEAGISANFNSRQQYQPFYRDPPLLSPTEHPPPQIPSSVHQASNPALDSLIAKYTMLDENYPTDGESMHITREAAPSAKLANGVDSEGNATNENSDIGSDVAD